MKKTDSLELVFYFIQFQSTSIFHCHLEGRRLLHKSILVFREAFVMQSFLWK